MPQRNPSGPAVTVVKPPPNFKLPENLDTANKVETNSVTKNTDWSSSKKQRAAASLFGSRLTDLKKKRKSQINSDLVTDHDEEETEETKDSFEERLDKDVESMEKVNENSKSHLLKVHIEEKSSESVTPNHKKQSFRPGRKTIKKTSNKKQTSGIKSVVTLDETTTKQVKEETSWAEQSHTRVFL